MKHQGEELYKIYINHDLEMTWDYFTARSMLAAHAFEWGKLLQCHLKINLAENGQIDCRFMFPKKKKKQQQKKKKNIWSQGAVCPPSRGNIFVYFHNIQSSSPLKQLGQSKPIFMWSTLKK